MLLAATLAATPLRAQQDSVSVRGRVLLVGADTVPVGGTWVVLHRIGQDRQAPLDSAQAAAGGAFDFRVPRDTAALHLVTAAYGGVQYFSDPIPMDRATTQVDVAVHDTSGTVPVALVARFIVVSAPSEDGSRTVVELLSLANDSRVTRVPGGPASPSWWVRLPRDAMGVELEPGELSPDALVLRADTAALLAPLPPGERQATLHYLLPADAASPAWHFDEPGTNVNLLVEEPEAEVRASWMTRADSGITIEGRPFARWSGTPAAGDAVVLTVPVAARLGTTALAVLVAVVAAALGAALYLALRRGAAEPETADMLVDRIARLDAAQRADGALAPPQYERERARLKARLASALARRRTPS